MKREIGGEFWDVPVANRDNRLFPEHTQWFLSGRSALHAIINDLGVVKSVSLPSWCCDSIIKPFVEAGIEVAFYPVFSQNGKFIREVSSKCDVLIIMDYFGYSYYCPDIRDYKGVLIRDVTHSLLSVAYSDADYFFGSSRKWCGFWTGGYAWTKNNHTLSLESMRDNGFLSLRKKGMQLKEKYIYDRGAEDKSYLKVFDEAENALDDIGVVPAAERDVRLAKRLDVEEIKRRRRENAAVLAKAFSGWLVFPEIKETDCPMFVPILVPDGKRNELRQYLILNEIYCPIHWPLSKYHKTDELTDCIYKNELSLVCDQRYTAEDMHRVIDTVNQFWKEA